MEYGSNPVPHREDMREAPLTAYAAAKVAGTHYLQMLHRTSGFPAVVLRPFFVDVNIKALISGSTLLS